jgi:hypothetical protein
MGDWASRSCRRWRDAKFRTGECSLQQSSMGDAAEYRVLPRRLNVVSPPLATLTGARASSRSNYTTAISNTRVDCCMYSLPRASSTTNLRSQLKI